MVGGFKAFFGCMVLLFSLAPGAMGEVQENSLSGYLRYPTSVALTNLDPQRAVTTFAFTLGNHIWEGLLRTSGGEIAPGVARRWTFSEDGTRYTFFLRSSQWSDGTPLEAEDFVYALQRLLDPEEKSPYAFFAYGVKHARAYNRGEIKNFSQVGVKALDTHTLEFSLERRDGSFLSRLGLLPFFPVPRHFLEQLEKDRYAQEIAWLLSNGPFTVESWTPGKEMTLRKKPRLLERLGGASSGDLRAGGGGSRRDSPSLRSRGVPFLPHPSLQVSFLHPPGERGSSFSTERWTGSVSTAGNVPKPPGGAT